MTKVTKSLVLFFYLFVGILAVFKESEGDEKFAALAKKIHGLCVDRTSIDESLVETVKQGNFVDGDVIKKYTRCILLETGVMDKEGEIYPNAVLQILPEKIRNKKAKEAGECSVKVKGTSDLNEKAYNLLKCVYNISPEDFVFI